MIAEQAPGIAGFKNYTRTKQTIASEVRILADFLQKRLDEREAEQCRRLMMKLAEDRFTLAVVGQFKRGKSSLMNAVIGRDILPTGTLPLTSAITVLKYGPLERLSIQRDGTACAEEVPISRIAEYVTEKGNPGNAKKVACASLELPVQFLRSGLEFVDTPGIGSAIESNTATTYDFLPQSDAVIFVTGVDTPITRAENDFLKSIQEHVRKIFFVLNKIDLAVDGERQEIVEFISGALKRQVQAVELRIFPVSSKTALASILSGEEGEYEKSGVKALQEALSDFLVTEKSGVLLVSVLDKALVLTKKASGRMQLLELAGRISREKIRDKTAALAERFQLLREARERTLIDAGERIISWAEEMISSEVDSFTAAETNALVEDLDEILRRSSWRLSSRAARQFSRHALERAARDVDDWATRQARRFNPELLEMLRNEWARIERELQRIPVSAAEILGAVGAVDPSGDEGCRPPVHEALSRPAAAKMEWDPGVPILNAFLPVLVVRSCIRKCLIPQIRRFTAACARRAGDKLMGEVHLAVNVLGAEMEKRASEIEFGIEQAMQGKRFLRGVDGRRQAVEIDLEEIAGEMEVLAGIDKRLRSIRTQLLQEKPAPGGGPSLEPETQPDDFSISAASAQKTSGELVERDIGIGNDVDFARDLNTRGCVICNRMADAAARFFAGRQYALSARESARRAHADSLGFCSLHTWQLEAMASPLGISLGFSTLMERLSSDLSRIASTAGSNPGESVRSLVQDPARCIVCRLLRDAEKKYIDDLAGFVQTVEGRKAYAYSQGVCLRHLGMLTVGVPDEQMVRFLLDHAAGRFFEISEDMRNYALKRDALRADMLNRDEKDAYLRALVHTAGAKGVCFPWELDSEA